MIHTDGHQAGNFKVSDIVDFLQLDFIHGHHKGNVERLHSVIWFLQEYVFQINV